MHRPRCQRPLPTDSELAHAIKVLARAQQDPVWDRTRAQLRLRSLLREFYPAALVIAGGLEDGLTAPLMRTLLAAAPTPTAAAALTMDELEDVLRRAGSRRNITKTAIWLHDVLGQDYLHQPPLVEAALGEHALALLRLLDVACANADVLEAATTEAFRTHPDAAIITSFPGMGPVLGARLLGEIGDDHTRFSDARALKAYASRSPRHPSLRPLSRRLHPTRQEPADGLRRLPVGLSSRPPHPARVPTTTVVVPPVTPTHGPNATSTTAYSAWSTTASPQGSSLPRGARVPGRSS